MFAAVISLAVLGVALGWLLGMASRYLTVEADPVEQDIFAMLPGSQCGQCGFAGCGQAAAALAKGEAPVTCCPPGGRALAEALAARLGITVDLAGMKEKAPAVAVVNESLCIGCTKCYKRCPTDAIMGAAKQIHVIFADACTGCEKCFEVCPTECIEMRPIAASVQTWYWPNPALARA